MHRFLLFRSLYKLEPSPGDFSGPDDLVSGRRGGVRRGAGGKEVLREAGGEEILLALDWPRDHLAAQLD